MQLRTTKTVTIGLPNDLSSSPEHIFPIAFGTEDSNHEPVESCFKQELEKFDQGVFVYHAATDRLVKVFVLLFASLQDSPERRERNYVSRGSAKGSYVVRDGYAGDYQQVYDILISCPNCRQHLKDGSTHTIVTLVQILSLHPKTTCSILIHPRITQVTSPGTAKKLVF